MERLEKSLEYLCWRYFAGCVMDVFDENAASQAKSGIESKADVWGINDALRQDVWLRARQFWVERSGRRLEEFPFSVDAVVKLYFYYRKRNNDERDSFRREVGTEPLFR